MKNLLKLILSSYFFVMFLILESISIFLAVRNTDKKTVFTSSANIISGFFSSKVNFVGNYFSLKEQNEILKLENEKLKNSKTLISELKFQKSKEIENTGYYYQSAAVIKNSVHKPYNIITLDIGSNNGIKEDMAVVSGTGAVGIVSAVSKNYCTVVSLLNSKLRLSAKVKRTNFFGSLNWDEKDYRYVILSDIPDYSSLYKGDKIVTSGFSSLFPEGISIGTVFEFEKKNSFYIIKVKLNQDFKKLRYVYVVDYLGKEERTQIEDSTIQLFNF